MSKISKLGWYWHRLWVMGPAEIALHVRKKLYAAGDAKGPPDFSRLSLAVSECFPRLPAKEQAPPELLDALRANVADILAGRWKAFGHLPLHVDDPPRWQFDYLAGRDVSTTASAFKLSNRAQPGGADIKVIWEPSRWYQLVRLAMAAWLLNDEKAREKCIQWLHDWVRTNPAYQGLNWTSGLEVGMRLMQFVWIDGFLTAAGAANKELDELRRLVIPPHLRYAWRFRSFGTSANNHLLGELAGVILALVRYPRLASVAAPLPQVQAQFEKEVLLQFAPDGGNNEQALGYHLFSWEFCWQAQEALKCAGLKVSEKVQERIRLGGEFYHAVKPEGDVWDYGDLDNAYVTPLFAREEQAAVEWWRWFGGGPRGAALKFFWGKFPGAPTRRRGQWQVFEASGYAIFENEAWFARFDFSPLGYLKMAPHGHLDALHISIWHRGQPVIIDPGTGTYYADIEMRNHFADWAAHNSPQPRKPGEPHPKRHGMFLWSGHHAVPALQRGDLKLSASIELPDGTVRRTVEFLPGENAFSIEDEVDARTAGGVVTRWKFDPSIELGSEAGGSGARVKTTQASLRFSFSNGWKVAAIFNPPADRRGKAGTHSSQLGDVPRDSIVSSAFRAMTCAPYLNLESTGAGPLKVKVAAG